MAIVVTHTRLEWIFQQFICIFGLGTMVRMDSFGVFGCTLVVYPDHGSKLHIVAEPVPSDRASNKAFNLLLKRDKDAAADWNPSVVAI